MSMKGITICAAVGVLLTIAGAQVAAKRIIPGKQLGKLNVGDLMEDMNWLKKADYGDAAMGKQWQTWEAKKPDPRNGKIINSLDVFSSLNEGGKYQIRVIRSTSPTFLLKQTIRVGTPLNVIQKSYPKLTKVADYQSPQFTSKVALYDEDKDGVAFEFKENSDGSVSKNEKCLSIWVYEPSSELMHLGSPTEYLLAKPGVKAATKQNKPLKKSEG